MPGVSNGIYWTISVGGMLPIKNKFQNEGKGGGGVLKDPFRRGPYKNIISWISNIDIILTIEKLQSIK